MPSHLSLATTKVVVDEYILNILTERKQAARGIGQSYEELWTAIQQIVTAGGKRLRPYLTMVGYGALDHSVIPVAAAQELIHVAMLIHDDVIDQDSVRHGQPNISGLYRAKYAAFAATAQAAHYADSAALLAGDALISEAYRLLWSTAFAPGIKSNLAAQLAGSVYSVIGGELLDVEAAFRTDIKFDPLQIYRYKTASYSFAGPLVSGAYCAEADAPTISALTSFAATAGIAYQMQDDLLDVFGDQTKTGKATALADLRAGKWTYLMHYHSAHASHTQAQRLERLRSGDDSEALLLRIKQDMADSGAQEATSTAVERYFAEAAGQLPSLPDGERRRHLTGFITTLRNRTA